MADGDLKSVSGSSSHSLREDVSSSTYLGAYTASTSGSVTLGSFTLSGSDASKFLITSGGSLYLNSNLDYESKKSYNFKNFS